MDEIPLIEPVTDAAEVENVRSVLESGYLTQGPYAERLERQFAECTGVAEAVCVPSCTAGLELALDAFEIGAGDEVVVPAFTYPATANAVVRTGAEPVLVDVNADSYTIDVEAARAAVTPATEALLPVSWGGYPLATEPIAELAAEFDLTVIEDAACAVGAEYDGEPTGSQFDASVFSFHPRKVVTTGEGGIVTTDDRDAAARMRTIKNFGTDPDADEIRFVRTDATNYRFSDILAAVGVAQLEKADEIVDRRRELARRYTDLLAEVDGILPPRAPDGVGHTFQSYCVYVDSGDDDTRDRLIEALAERGIETQIGTYALQCTEAFADAERGGDLETSRDLYRNLLTLPVAHSMTEADQRRVVTALEDSLGEHL